jgi:transcriptional regulator with XRE-family HTH domain
MDESVKRAFGRKLSKLSIDRGWNQSALARMASKFLPSPMSRDSVSKYCRGMNWPGPTHMAALARALGVAVDELAPETGGSTFEMRQTGDKIRLKIDQTVSLDQAARIAEILAEKKNAG